MKNLLKDLLILGGLAVLLTGCAGECTDESAAALVNSFRFINYTDGGTTHQDFTVAGRTDANIGFAAFSGMKFSGENLADISVTATGTGAALYSRNYNPGSLANHYFGITYGTQADVRMCLVRGGFISAGNGGLLIANLDRIRGSIDVRLQRPSDGAIVHTVPNLGVGGDQLTQPSQAQLGITPGNWTIFATLPGTSTVVWTKSITVKANEFTVVLPFDGVGASQEPVPFQVPAFAT